LDDVIKEFSKTNRRLDFGAKYIKWHIRYKFSMLFNF
jgi:hypothetical protein